MQLSTKLKTLILTAAFFVPFISPAWANPCTVKATHTGGGMIRIQGTCPSGYHGGYSIKVDGTNVASGSAGDFGSGGTVDVTKGPFANGTRNIDLDCIETTIVVGLPDTCSTTVTVTGVTTETCTDDCTSDADCAAGEHCDKSCDPNGIVGNCVAGPPPPPDDSCEGGTGIKTGLGCIPTDPTGLVEKILQIAIGVSSGIAMLLLISGAFRILTSSGDPKAVMGAKDTITSAIGGLLLILLSVAILNIIGIKILDIPIWGTP